jgi:hypothetical protein
MSETKHTTNLEIRASTQGIKDVGKELKTAFDPKVMAGFAAGIERISDVMEGLAAHQQRIIDLQKDANREAVSGAAAIVQAIQGRASGDASSREEEKRRRAEERAKREAAKQDRDASAQRKRMMAYGAVAGYGMGSLAGHGANLAASATGGPGLAEGMLGMLPFVGPGLAGVVSTLRHYSGMAEQAGSARGGAFGQTGLRGYGGLGFGGYGLSQLEAPGIAAQFGSATGLRGESLEALIPTLLGANRGMGLNLGGLARANTTSGGSAGTDGNLRAMREAVGAGMLMGIRDGRLDDYLGEIATNIESLRADGIPLTTNTLTQLGLLYGQQGLQGEAAGRAATTSLNTVRNLGEDTTMASQMALRIAMAGDQRTGGGGPRTYEEALAYIEANPEMMTQAMLNETTTLGGGNRSVTAGLVRQMGLVPSRNAAMTVAGRLTGRGGTGDIPGLDWAAEEAQALMEERAGQARGSAGASIHRASLTDQQIGFGEGAAGSAVRNLENLEMNIAGRMVDRLGPIMQDMVGTLEELLASYDEAGGGTAGLTAMFRDVIGPILESTVADVAAAAESASADEGDAAAGGQGVLTGARTDTPMQLQRAIHDAFLGALRDFFGESGASIGRTILNLARRSAMP